MTMQMKLISTSSNGQHSLLALILNITIDQHHESRHFWLFFWQHINTDAMLIQNSKAYMQFLCCMLNFC